MMREGLHRYHGKRVLFLQGPLGRFFSRLAADLRQVGAEVYKVNFNGGDWFCSLGVPWDGVINFTGYPGDWPAFFSGLLDSHHIDTVLLFGDCRPIHVPTLGIARQRGLTIGVFEEGYLRPDYITLEQGGVNNRSSLPQDPSFYRSRGREPTPPSRSPGSTFRYSALWGIVYYTAATFGKPVFRHYWHHRPLGVLEGLYWVQSLWRKLRYRWKEKDLSSRLSGPDRDKFFLVPLQTCGDAQIKVHSRFRTVPRFIEHVVRSFAHSAPLDSVLVIKHHPLDRGYADYTDLIHHLIDRYGLGSRCLYIHDQHLPTLLRNTLGVVVINSTVGLSAVGEGVPVQVCGEAIYDMTGLTFQGELDEFWNGTAAFKPDMALWSDFRNYLVAHTQIGGSFYRRLSRTGYRSGVAWSAFNNLPEQETIPLPERVISSIADPSKVPTDAYLLEAVHDSLPKAATNENVLAPAEDFAAAS